jgi:amidophosphoribosyltransferase
MISEIYKPDDDRFHDHCGVFGIFGHAEAAKMTYLGLYALQHRGQESAGIASTDGSNVHVHKAMGHVQEIFTPGVISQLPGAAAMGHTRYSTAGDTILMNAQPVVIDCNKGKLALGHNGNLTNALEVRRRLEHRGSIFQTTSDTEVIVHLIARSTARNLSGAIADALNQVEGAYSLLLSTCAKWSRARWCGFRARVWSPSALPWKSHINTAFSSMSIFRAPTAWCLADR